jgi:hypothetical protein
MYLYFLEGGSDKFTELRRVENARRKCYQNIYIVVHKRRKY